MKFKIVLINFPFDDFSGSKLRPVLCLTDYISKHMHIIFAPITSNLDNATEKSDLIINPSDSGFLNTGLKVGSVIKVHRLVTASDHIIQKVIGVLPDSYHKIIDEKIKLVFNIDQ